MSMILLMEFSEWVHEVQTAFTFRTNTFLIPNIHLEGLDFLKKHTIVVRRTLLWMLNVITHLT